jgi:solute carrier family 25 (adenine nucleotide translocator) protein 4/5/6/31
MYSLDYCRARLTNDIIRAYKGGERQFSNLFDVYRQTIKDEGIVGLYRGFTISCFGVFIYRGIYFGLYDTYKPLLGEDPSFWALYLLGYFSFLVASFMSYPIDVVRRLKMGNELFQNRNSSKIVLIILRNNPLFLMKGVNVNVPRGFVAAGVLSIFDKLIQKYAHIKNLKQ